MVETFESRASDAVALHQGRVIKTLGDSVLYVCAVRRRRPTTWPPRSSPRSAATTTLPDVRVGLATGPVVLRLGDVFGPAVNLAARMTTVARRNRVIADQRTAELLPPSRASPCAPCPSRPVHGFGDLEPGRA